MFGVGCSMGPVLHCWYSWLDKFYIGKALHTVGKKVLVDQLVCSPILGAWYFLGENEMQKLFWFPFIQGIIYFCINITANNILICNI